MILWARLIEGLQRDCLVGTTHWRQILALAFLTVFGSTTANALGDPATSKYKLLQIQGFKIHVSPEMETQAELLQKVLRVLDAKLEEASSLIGRDRIASLHQVQFWIELSKTDGSTVYHPAREWLVEHNYNPDKAHGIEISNSRNFIKWIADDQPMMIVHELAHAYMFLVLGEKYPSLQEAWKNALTNHLYKSVPYIHGGNRQAYALTDSFEFFAELTEAYLGKNDYFPYVRSDLQNYDPVGFHVMERVWGVRSRGTIRAI
jgi:hypothetical protein